MGGKILIATCLFQELHNKELELSRVQQEQRIQEELLQIKKKELDAREMVLLELELRIIMNPTPEPNKRKGKFSKTRLKVSELVPGCSGVLTAPSASFQSLKKEPGQISSPQDFVHTFTVQHADKRFGPGTPPRSPFALRAITSEYYVQVKIPRFQFFLLQDPPDSIRLV